MNAKEDRKNGCCLEMIVAMVKELQRTILGKELRCAVTMAWV